MRQHGLAQVHSIPVQKLQQQARRVRCQGGPQCLVLCCLLRDSMTFGLHGHGPGYVFTVSRCPDVQCQHGLVHRAGESITHMQQRRHHITARGLQLSSLLKRV